jgi:hypothetical protein
MMQSCLIIFTKTLRLRGSARGSEFEAARRTAEGDARVRLAKFNLLLARIDLLDSLCSRARCTSLAKTGGIYYFATNSQENLGAPYHPFPSIIGLTEIVQSKKP